MRKVILVLALTLLATLASAQTICPDTDPMHCHASGQTAPPTDPSLTYLDKIVVPPPDTSGAQATLTVDKLFFDKTHEMVVGHDQQGVQRNLVCFKSRHDCLQLVKGKTYPMVMVPNNNNLAYPVDYVKLVDTDNACNYHMFATVMTIEPVKGELRAMYTQVSLHAVTTTDAMITRYTTGQDAQYACCKTTVADIMEEAGVISAVKTKEEYQHEIAVAQKDADERNAFQKRADDSMREYCIEEAKHRAKFPPADPRTATHGCSDWLKEHPVKK